MSALLIYKNESHAIAEWMADFEARHEAARKRQNEWFDRTLAEFGVTADEVGHELLSYGPRLAGIAWPRDRDVPKGWRRNSDDRRTIVPHNGTKIGKTAAAEMQALRVPDIRSELDKQFGVPWSVFVRESNHMYRPGYRFEHGAGWITWGTRDVEDELDRMREYGWVRVPLVEFIERFGEDAL